MKSQTLFVFYNTNKVGNIFIDSADLFCFEYSQEWLKREDSFALSQSLPLAAVTYAKSAHTYFNNLLPEGKIRQLISRRLGVSEENDFALLKALGEDCSGAFTVTPFENFAKNQQPGYKPINLKQIAAIAKVQPIFYLGLSESELRLSLAGAQDKIAVYYKADQFFLPQNGAPSTHILKLPGKDYACLTENEFFISQLAIDCELKMSSSQLVSEASFTALLSERYDRSFLLGAVKRLHQEDFCQAMGISYKNKYQEEGGPSFKTSFELVEKVSATPLEDIEQLLKWLVFNVCVGNCDHHGKNLSFLMSEKQRWKLSPFYDLICTRVYKNLTKYQAMSIGGSFDGANLSMNNWKKLTAEIKFSYPNLVREIALPIIDTILAGIDNHVEQFKSKKSHEFIKAVAKEVKSLSKRVERSFFI